MKTTMSAVKALLAILALAVTATSWARDQVDTSIRNFERGLRRAVVVDGERDQHWTLAEGMARARVPGISIAVIRHGELAWARAYGLKSAGSAERIDVETAFSVGSLSKVGTAALALKLADTGVIDPDRDVNGYLRRWKIPANGYTAIRPVTLSGILSHSAGLTLDGFPDFQPGDTLPSVLDTLDGSGSSKTEAVRVFYTPGSQTSYSGGGTTVAQLLIEDVTGKSFTDVAREQLFTPLGMERSTYEQPLPESFGNIARAHDKHGKPTALPRGWEAMPETAASGLWSTPSDYARMLVALIRSYQGQGGSFLGAPLARRMMTETGRSKVGLGPFMEGRGAARRFFHTGSNDSYKAWMEGHLATGDGLVIFTNGANGFHLIPEVRRAVAAAEGWAIPTVVHIPKVMVAAQTLSEYVGLYEVVPPRGVADTRVNVTVFPVGFEILDEDGKLRFRYAGNQGGMPFLPEDQTHFVADYDEDVRVEFVRGYDGHVESLIYREGEYALEATKRR
jgi:CubicO group peptidase (beta-lactamase class C family)